MDHSISPLIQSAQRSYAEHLGAYYGNQTFIANGKRPGVLDLAFGDPHEMPQPEVVDALSSGLVPQRPDWFAYERGTEPARQHVAARLSAELGAQVAVDDVALTNGAFAGLMVCLRTVCAPGTSVLHLTPTWFYYDAMIRAVGAVPVPVPTVEGTWQLDVDAIAAALTPATSAVILNTPNNPTGVVYGERDLDELGNLLADASSRYGRPIYLISDESYRRIVYRDVTFVSPVARYPFSFLVYTYTKALLIPGERIGYVALAPAMPQKCQMRDALTVSQLMTGWAFPNNSLQFALSALDELVIDVAAIERRHDLAFEGLRAQGYEVQRSEGGFYLFARAPDGDDWALAEELAGRDVLVMPGRLMAAPGWFRIALTCPDETVAAALERFPTSTRVGGDHGNGGRDRRAPVDRVGST